MRETEPRPRRARAERVGVRALPTGTSGCAANLDEGEPYGLPGTYLNSFYELRPLPYAEAGYGYPESGQTIVNVTNGKIIRLLVDDEPFDVRYGELLAHERVLDLRAGLLRRRVEWVSPAGTPVRVRSTRLVSFAQRPVAAILYEVEPLDEPVRVVVQSELVANEPLPDADGGPARRRRARVAARSRRSSSTTTAAGRARALDAAQRAADGGGDGPRRRRPRRHATTSESAPRPRPRHRRRRPRAGQRLRLVKFLAYGWSSQRSLPALRDQVVAALAEARHTGWDGLARRPARRISTTSGTAPTSSSTATPSCSRPSGSRSSTRSRPARAPSSARSRPRA